MIARLVRSRQTKSSHRRSESESIDDPWTLCLAKTLDRLKGKCRIGHSLINRSVVAFVFTF